MGVPVVTNLIKSGAMIYYGPEDETIPDETTILFGVTWGGNWARLGFTAAPLTFAYTSEEDEQTVEEVLAAVARDRIGEALTIETILAELTGEYLMMAMGFDGADLDETAAGVSQKQFEEFKFGGKQKLKVQMFGFEGLYVDTAGTDQAIRVFIHRATMMLNGPLTWTKKAAGIVGIPLQIKALADTGQSAGEELAHFQRIMLDATG